MKEQYEEETQGIEMNRKATKDMGKGEEVDMNGIFDEKVYILWKTKKLMMVVMTSLTNETSHISKQRHLMTPQEEVSLQYYT